MDKTTETRVHALWLKAVRRNGIHIKRVPEHLRTPELCLAAVTENGWAFSWVPLELRTPELLLASIASTKRFYLSRPDTPESQSRIAILAAMEAIQRARLSSREPATA